MKPILILNQKKKRKKKLKNPRKLHPEKGKKIRTLSLKVQKEQEYPMIQWTDLGNPEIQKALILYNDRVNCHRQMIQLDQELEENPTEKKIQQLAELRIRNLIAFKELQSYNDTGSFCYEHPLIAHFSLRQELKRMLEKNPDEFLDEFFKVKGNVTRYRSYLNRAKAKADEKKRWKQQLEKHLEREQLMKELLAENNQ